MPHICDMHSVGVLISRHDDTEFLVLTRVGVPSGVAPVAGHVFDAHTSPADAARAEVREELGLTVTGLWPLTQGWRPNRCGGHVPAGTSGPFGHFWWIFTAEVEGELAPDPAEARDPRWIPTSQLQKLAERTAAWARSEIPDEDWQHEPGLEPVWCHWLHHIALIELPETDQARIAVIAATPPVAA